MICPFSPLGWPTRLLPSLRMGEYRIPRGPPQARGWATAFGVGAGGLIGLGKGHAWCFRRKPLQVSLTLVTRHSGFRRPTLATMFKLTVACPVILGLAISAVLNPGPVLRLEVLFWILAVAATELLPIPTRGGVQLSLSFPLFLGASLLYQPYVAAAIAPLGTFDPRELKRTLPWQNALFNRAEI